MCWDGEGRAWLMPKIRESHPLLKPSCFTLRPACTLFVCTEYKNLLHCADECTRHNNGNMFWPECFRHTSVKYRVRSGGGRTTNGLCDKEGGWQIGQGWSVKSRALVSLKVPGFWDEMEMELLTFISTLSTADCPAMYFVSFTDK